MEIFGEQHVTQRQEQLQKQSLAELNKQIQKSRDRFENEVFGTSENAFLEAPDFTVKRKYDYMPRGRKIARLANKYLPPVEQPQELQPAQPIEEEQPQLSKDQKAAIKAEKKLILHEHELRTERENRALIDEGREMLAKDFKHEKKLLEEKLEVINLSENASLKDLKFGDSEGKLKVKVAAQEDRVRALDHFSQMLPPGSKVREEYMQKKEEAQVELASLKNKLKIEQLEKSGNTADANVEASTRKRHKAMDWVRKHFGNPDLTFSRQDTSYEVPETHKLIVNEGRMSLGGTKPMYLFVQRDEHGNMEKEYLYKEAVNCVGFRKPDRAFATAAASEVQRIVCGAENTVPAFVAYNANQEAIGTFQEKLVKQDGGMDIYAWQKAEAPTTAMGTDISDQILREHVLDWLLCNFDTKGENFVNTAHGLVSIDKEASFTHISKPGAQHMSLDFAPHGNDTIYNVMFKRFVNNVGDGVLQDLNLGSVEEAVARVEQENTDQYMQRFAPMLDARYGPAYIDGKVNVSRRQAETLIRQRKEGIRQEYRVFFGKLLKAKLDNLEKRQRELTALGDEAPIVDLQTVNNKLAAFHTKYDACLNLTDAENPLFKFSTD